MSKPAVDIHGATCVHIHKSSNGNIPCGKPADQGKSVNHGWLCGKHYTAVKNNWKGK